MASYLTSDTLIASIQRRGNIPQSQVTYEPTDFLALANEEISIGILPSLLQFHQEFLVYEQDVILEDFVSAYDIPLRAMGNKIRNIFYKDNNGNLMEMARIFQEQEPYFQKRSTINYPSCFYLQNNSIVLVPPIATQPVGQLVIKYYQRPNQLVPYSRVATIQAINGGVITLDQIPANFVLSLENVQQAYDFCETKGGHRVQGTAFPTAINIPGLTVTFNATDIPTNLLVGDMLCLEEECYIPQVPDEMHAMLAQRVVCRIMEAQGDTAGLTNANLKLQEMELKIGNLIDNRAEGTPMKINNLRSVLRSAKIRRRRNTY
jgi:hypothetical protein